MLPVRVVAATCHPREIECGSAKPSGALAGHHDFLDHPQVGACVLSPVVRKSSAHQRVLESGCLRNVDGLAVHLGPATLHCNVLIVASHVDDDTDQWRTAIPEGHRHCDLGYSMHVIDGPVEGVDDPDPSLIPVGTTFFFSENPVGRKVTGNHASNRSFGVPIYLSDGVDCALEFSFEGLEEAGLDDVRTGSGGTDRNPDITFPHGLRLYWAYASTVTSSRPAMFLALVGAVVSVLAFPPFGPGILIIPGITLFFIALRGLETGRQGFWVGMFYGLAFFGGLMWWLIELELIALVLVPVEALFFGLYGLWLVRLNDAGPARWLTLAVGGWAVMELLRYHFPVGGLEWGAAGYALSDQIWSRFPAAVIGTSGLTVIVVAIAAILTLLVLRSSGRATLLWGIGVVVVLGSSFLWLQGQILADVGRVATIVQGSTPCPFEKCPPNERLRTFEQHLALTQTLEQAGLVIWAEGSTGSTNADPVNNPEIGGAIAEEARRLSSRFIVGSDRVVSDTEWINANVYFEVDGTIVGEYRKQHPVPFGEYIPLRPLFDWIPALSQVPRDMIRGDGPVLFDDIGSIISFEGGFSRYAIEVRREGAEVILINTNEGSYGLTPTSDQFIGMTRMRAVELGVPIIHAAVTGKSTFIDIDGSLGEVSGLGTKEILDRGYRGDSRDTPYTATGDLLMYLAAIAGLIVLLVPSGHRSTKEE